MKYDLEVGPLGSGTSSSATETAYFEGVLFSLLRQRLSIECGDFSFSVWCPLVEADQQTAAAQTLCLWFQVKKPEHVEKLDANAICIDKSN